MNLSDYVDLLLKKKGKTFSERESSACIEGNEKHKETDHETVKKEMKDQKEKRQKENREIEYLKNSAVDLDPFKAQKGGIFLGPDFRVILGPDTKLKTSDKPWVNDKDNTIVVSDIPYVDGIVDAKYYDAAGSVFSMTTDENYRYFKGNGLPSTPMGKFPVQKGSKAYPYYEAAPGGHDPNTGIPGSDYSSAAAIGVSPYNLDITVPKNPVYNEEPQPINSLITGVVLTGTVWHAEIANASQDAWYNPISILPMDQCFAHPYSEQYHLHAYSWKCLPDEQNTDGQSPLLGYALDGFGVYGPRDKDGKIITNDQLDECHGMTSEVMWDGKLTNMYHYVLNNEYPYSIGCFRGDIDIKLALGNTTKHEMHGKKGHGQHAMRHGQIDPQEPQPEITDIPRVFA